MLDEDSQFDKAQAVGPIFALKQMIVIPKSIPNPNINVLPEVGEKYMAGLFS
jgi:hypothetical protein